MAKKIFEVHYFLRLPKAIFQKSAGHMLPPLPPATMALLEFTQDIILKKFVMSLEKI